MNPTSTTDHHTGAGSLLARSVAFCVTLMALLITLGVQSAEAAQPAQTGAPYIDVLVDPVEAGEFVDVYGDGFVPGEIVDVEFGGSTIASVTADGAGTFLAFGIVDPLMPPGTHPLDANGDLGSWATTELTVVDPGGRPVSSNRFPYVGTLQWSVEPGGVIDVVGGDFVPGEVVTIEFGGSVVDVVTADPFGEFAATGWVDALMPAGFHPLDAWGDLGSGATSDVEVLASTTNPLLYGWGAAPQGGDAVVDGDGFAPFETVWISFGGLSRSVVADDRGAFTAIVPVPLDMPVGDHPLDAWGDTGTFATIDQIVDPAVVSQPLPPVATQPATTTTQPTTTSTTTQPPTTTTTTKTTITTTITTSGDDERPATTTAPTETEEETSEDVRVETETDTETSESVSDDDDGTSLLGAGVAGIAVAGVGIGISALVARRRR